MLSKQPFNLKNVSAEDIDKELMRFAIIAEFDAISLYEQMASETKNHHLQKVLLDVAKEEKEHVGEFQELLNKIDKEHVKAVAEGGEEVKELTGK